MKVLDLFAGLRGWSEPFEARGHEVRTLELNKAFKDITYRMDVRSFAVNPDRWLDGWRPDVLLASPPCTSFSVMTIGRNWTKDHQPKTDKARLGLELVGATLGLIDKLDPRYFVVENPRAKLRKMPQMAHLERRTVTYCQYGEANMKPTDLWGGFPPSLALKAPCKNGAGCHTAAPRGSMTGTQGRDSAECAKIPAGLALAVCLAAELDLARQAPAAAWRQDSDIPNQGRLL